MKTLTLKEAQAPYTLTVDRDALAQHLMLIQQDGQPVGVLVPYDEYQTFRAWRQERELERPYQYLIARPHPWRRQLCLKGRNMTIGQLISTMQANHLTPDEAADDLDLPVEQVKEALAYYELHRDLIEAEAREEAARLAARIPTADDVLQALIASGEIRLSDLGEHLRMNLIPGTTLARVHEALAGVSVPIEEMIREEREKYDV